VAAVNAGAAAARGVPARASQHLADRIFRVAVLFNAALTLFWLVTYFAGGSYFFDDYRVGWDTVARVALGIGFFYVAWGVVWLGIKRTLLRRFAGFSAEDLRDTFSSRMDRPYEVAAIVGRYPERRIRIVDMIGRRGRFVTLAAASFFYLYVQLRARPDDGFATAFFNDNLLDGVIINWICLAFYYSSGSVAACFFGAQTRVMDGVLARANTLSLTMLWGGFKFVMLPIGAQLSIHFSREEFAPVFALIWGTYLVTDTSAEVFGSLFGRQDIRVRGLGDVNRKSVTGVVAGFFAALLFCLAVIVGHGLGPQWIVLGVVLSMANPLIELYAPRGTDDFTMATANALICWGFGAWLR
jgi:dolichol kinase